MANKSESEAIPLKTASIRKKNCCLYCRNTYTNIALHLETAHGEEDEVMKFKVLPKGSKERRKIIDIIRKKGNFDSRKFGDALIPVRMPRKRKQTEYVVCPRCRGYYSKETLRKHYSVCQMEGQQAKKFNRGLMVLSRRLSIDVHCLASETLKSVLSHLRTDIIYDTIRHDPLIISYGNKLCKKLKSPHHSKEIRAKLRQLGRFLRKVKSLNSEIIDFCSIYHPKHYDSCTRAAQSLSVLSDDDQIYKYPVVALSMGTLLKKVGKHAKTYLIKNGQQEKINNSQQFMHLLMEDYGTAINKTALETLSKMHREKPVKLPSIDDVTKFYKYLSQQRKFYFHEVNERGFTYQNWRKLASYTLISIQVFNRRRPGETERMLVSDFKNAKSINFEDDRLLFNSLNITEQQAAENYILIMLRGKLNRTVSALVDKENFESLKVVVNFRLEAGVHESNPYVFGLPGGDNREYRHLDACSLMRLFSNSCDLGKPDTLRSTLLRKHLATYCSVMGFREDEVSDIANHLGHEQKIHKEFYRIPVVTREITQMSQLLERALEPTVAKSQLETVHTSLGKELELSLNESTYTNITNNLAEEEKVQNFLGNESEISLNKSKYLNIRDNLHEESSVNEETVFDEQELATQEKDDSRNFYENPVLQNDEGLSYYYAEDETNPAEVIISTTNNLENTNPEAEIPPMKEFRVVLSPLKLEKIQEHLLAVPKRGRYELSPTNSSTNSVNDSDFENGSSEEIELTPKKKKKKGQKSLRRLWSTPEKTLVKNIFKKNIERKTVPSYLLCENAVKSYPDLQHRTPKQLQLWIKFIIDKAKNTSSHLARNTDPLEDKIVRRAWTTPEKLVVQKLFQKFINNLKLPTFISCKKAVRDYPELKNRTDKQLYAYINNQIKKNMKTPGFGEYSPNKKETLLLSPDKNIVKQLFAKQIAASEEPAVSQIVSIMQRHPILKYKSIEGVAELIKFEIKRKEFSKQVKRRLVME